MAPQSLITPERLTPAYFFETNARKKLTPGLKGTCENSVWNY